MMEVEIDLSDSCALCRKQQNSVIFLAEQPFKVNVCGHKFCSSCIKQELHKKRQFLCPRCSATVSEDKLSTKSAEEMEVEKDEAIRRKVKKVFNKTEEDFENLSEYKDYEELVEDIIYNIVHGIDVSKMEEKLEKYSQENAKSITLKVTELQKRSREELDLIKEEELKRTKREKEFRESLRQELLSKNELKKQINKEKLGEGISSPTPTVAAINPLITLMNQRPLPKELPVKNKPATNAVKSNEQIRKIHHAGGYDHANYDKRNWTEIRSQLSLY